MTLHVRIPDPENPDPEAIRTAVRVLRDGGIVAFPTETVYGLAVDAWNPTALRTLVRLKGRPWDKPFPVLVTGREVLPRLVRDPLPEVLEVLADAFWPGPLTMILRGREGLSAEILGPGKTLAVRETSHPVARSLIEQFGNPVTGTSANPSGAPETTDPDTVARVLGTGLDLILEAGRAPGDLPSTLLDLTVRPPRIRRAGPVTRAAIRQVLGMPVA